MLLEGTNNSMNCKQPKELQTEKTTSRHNKSKEANITEVISQDYVCTYEDNFVLQYIISSPKDKKLVDIGDAFLTKAELECLIHDNEFRNDDVISAYVYCVNAQEHLCYRVGGKVYLENTFISTLIKRDGDVEISPTDHNQIIKRVNIYLDHDMVFVPINITRKYWYLAVINAKKHEIQVLDSFSAAMDRSDLTTTLRGLQNQLNIVSQSKEFHQDHEWQDLNVTTWPVIKQFQEPMQSDSSSRGLFMLKYMGYWTRDMLSYCVMQMMSDVARDPKRRVKFDVQSLAKLFDSWSRINYDISSCKLDGYKLRKRFLVNMRKYNENESEDNIPHVVQEILKRVKTLVY